MKLSKIALLSAATLAAAQPQHNHARLHAKRGTPVEARDATFTEYVAGPVEIVYELNGKTISEAAVQEGIKAGKYIIVGDAIQSAAPSIPAAIPTPSPIAAAEPSSVQAAAFIEKPSSSSSPTPTPTPSSPSYKEPKAPSTDTPKPSSTGAPKPPPPAATAPASAAPSSSDSGSPSGGNGDVSAEFPSGKVPCSKFPSDYGAVPADWLNLKGWTGIQMTPRYSTNAKSISEIHTAISGGCVPNSFCSYACPAGYQKSQWPSAQGNTGQSIGGLYCNSNGMLELSRPAYKTICQSGAGGVSVKNKLSKNVAICRTDYPGTESETIALNTTPGSTNPVTNPLASEYYEWEGSPTSAQYYINPAGVAVKDACQWGTAGSNRGNWAPVNMGVGKTGAGTFISIFPNAPTNPDGTLDFHIAITGDVTGKCEYKGGKYYNNGVLSPTGCTTGITPGGSAVFEFS